jgi:multicomponent Na+:H+ antiporter subunit F
MTAWLAATIALLPPFAVALWVCWRANTADRLVAVQFATSTAILILATMSFAVDQPSEVDLALTLALLSLPGTLIFAVFVERWL